MKLHSYLFFTLFFAVHFSLNAQQIGYTDTSYKKNTSANTDGKIHLHVDYKPLFEGCNETNMFSLEKQICTHEKIKSFIQENLQYPEAARTSGISGKVKIWLVVELDGSISEARVKASDAKELEEEAIRVASSLPSLIPAKLKEETVRAFHEIMVEFKLTDKSE